MRPGLRLCVILAGLLGLAAGVAADPSLLLARHGRHAVRPLPPRAYRASSLSAGAPSPRPPARRNDAVGEHRSTQTWPLRTA